VTLKPETCPCCGQRDPVDIIDDDGRKKFYRCDRCNITWMQNGFSGKPVLSSLQGGSRNLYKSFRNAGCDESRARTLVYERTNYGKIVHHKGESWQRDSLYSNEQNAETRAGSLKARGFVTKVKSVVIKVGQGKTARRWIVYINMHARTKQ
jgi:uncharacterized protein YlbG (UPF0298 family)